LKVLLVDYSARGHAFADLFSRTNGDVVVHYAPGCAAITTNRVRSVPQLHWAAPDAMIRYSQREKIDLVFVAHDEALSKELVNIFRRAGFPTIGPSREAIRLEVSKSYAKELFARYGIPSPEYQSCDDVDAARTYVQKVPYKVVVKADGRCGGNGAFVCDTVADALRAIGRLMVDRIFGPAGQRVVIEKRIYGQEFSFFALVDGNGFLTLPMALDYPRSDDGNRGVITGGMGAISHPPLESGELIAKVEAGILRPLLRCIAEQRLRYSGPIYLGCMLVEGEPYLLEVNARMGNPESQVVLTRIESDFVALCQAILEQRIADQKLVLNDLHFCDTAATQGPTKRGGPEGPEGDFPGWPFGALGRHFPVTGLDTVDPSQCRVFIGQATYLPGTGLVTDGGRVLHVVGFGDSPRQAAEHSQAGIRNISFEGIRYRHDIGFVMPWEEAVEATGIRPQG
jgi:phosphoribosylamine---glycine ligase